MHFENLEPRWLPCTPTDVLEIINTVNAGTYNEAADVNADGMVSPIDVLLAINEANRIAAGASNQLPLVLHLIPGGRSSLWFSACGDEYDVTLLSRQSLNPDKVEVRVGAVVYSPISIGMFGDYQRWEFHIAGRGMELLSILGDFEDELLTVIIG